MSLGAGVCVTLRWKTKYAFLLFKFHPCCVLRCGSKAKMSFFCPPPENLNLKLNTKREPARALEFSGCCFSKLRFIGQTHASPSSALTGRRFQDPFLPPFVMKKSERQHPLQAGCKDNSSQPAFRFRRCNISLLLPARLLSCLLAAVSSAVLMAAMTRRLLETESLFLQSCRAFAAVTLQHECAADAIDVECACVCICVFLQAYGGDGFMQRVRRIGFDARSTVMVSW